MRRVVPFIMLGMLAIGCKPATTEVVQSETFALGVSTGILDGKKIREASGLIASIKNDGLLWTHNDSGNDPEIFLVDTLGQIRCTVHLTGIKNRDWEDIMINSEPNGKTYLYIGEIGDNSAVYSHKFLYRIEEPIIPNHVSDTTIQHVDGIKFQLADGARDTEALFADPISGDFYIFSKREQRVNLYKLSKPLSTTEAMTAERVASNLPFSLIVAASISKDGTEILAKNYNSIFYWKRNSSESIEEAVKRSPQMLPYQAEPQGEAIAFNRNGTGFYTLSEQKKKMPQHLFFYKRK